MSDNLKSVNQTKKLLLSYSTVLVLFFIVITSIITINISWHKWVHSVLLFGITAIIIAIILFSVNKRRVAKFIITVLPPYLLFSTSILLKQDNHLSSIYTFLTPKFFIILSLMAPIIVFGLKNIKNMVISLLTLIPIILFFDYFHSLVGVNIHELNYDQSFYPLFIILFCAFYGVALSFLLLQQRANIRYSLKVDQQKTIISEEKAELESLNSKLQFQSKMYSILDITSKNKNLVFLLQETLEQILNVDSLNIKNKGLIFLTNDKNELEIAAHENVDKLLKTCGTIKVGQCLCGKVLENGLNYFCNSVGGDHTIKPEGMTPHGHYVIPILSRKKTLGVINIYINAGEKKNLDIERFLENVAKILARKITEVQNKEKLISKNIEIKNQGDTLTSTLSELDQSIRYAKNLQRSLVPNQVTIDKHFKDSSFLFKPRDKVSGDFYFAHEVNNNLFFGIGDCTGHGIPGAFLAAMSIEAVKRVIIANGDKKPNLILSKLRDVAIDRFSINHGETRSDAMDAALCMYDKNSDKLYFSGGFINLLIVRDNSEIIIFNATKCPIGSYPVKRDFELNEINLKKGDVIYLSSDGYVDQFGHDKSRIQKKPSKFKRRRFRELLIDISHFTCDEQVHILKKTINDWRGEIEQTDDITVFIAKH